MKIEIKEVKEAMELAEKEIREWLLFLGKCRKRLEKLKKLK